MSKKKGLSVEEKRSRMMDFFFEKKDFFQLKELERQCQKEKGITSMSVKEILQSLVDDGMVDTEKIGTSVYFWAFPSKASQNRKAKIAELEAKVADVKEKVAVVEEAVAKETKGKEASDERDEIMGKLGELESEKKRLTDEVSKYKDCDPEVVEQMRQQSEQARLDANRWTDNLFSFKSWMKSKFSCEEDMINKQFEIPENLDYIEA